MEEQAREMNYEKMPKICSSAPHAMSPRKEEVVGNDQADEDFSSPTPVKAKESLRIKSKEELIELPDKCRALLEFFDRLTSSLRLLSLRKKTPSFENISSQVEILTGRKFQFIHLAQIKYLLPEAVQIDKVLTHDETTKGMKSDIHIALQFDIVKDHLEGSVFLALSNLFSSRLRHFSITHPEDNVPEAELPEPLSQKSFTITGDSLSEDPSTLCEIETINPSHLPPTFKRCFNQKATDMAIEKIDLFPPARSPCDANLQIDVVMENPKSVSDICIDGVGSMGESTPVKLLSENDSVSVETPVQSTPLRPISPTKSTLTCEDEDKTRVNQNCMQSSSSAKKSLDFYRVGGKGTIFQQKQKAVSLPELIQLIHQIFQSVNFRSITKEELVQKIIMNNFEIDNYSEVEMQITHLEKVVPDWFYKKLTPSGDLLYKVKKVSDLSAVCEKVDDI